MVCWEEKIREEYLGKNYTRLFRTILYASREIGLKEALRILEKCVNKKRMKWLQENLDKFGRSGDPIMDAFHIFFEEYLGLKLGRDGEIVERTEKRLVVRWWNQCPVLEVCRKYGLDTRIVCRYAYHRPVDNFIKAIDSRLVFYRNYEKIRPYHPYCEEIIELNT